MKITNENGIPVPIYRAICSNWYSGHNSEHFCSVTALLKGVKQFVLEKRYSNELEEEASDNVWSLLGSAMHAVIERVGGDNSLVEERLQVKINGEIVSGGVDLYENGTITDFKFTSVWSWILVGRISEWEKQLNCYAYLYKKAGFPVNKLEIIAIFRDWQKSKFKAKKSSECYPKQIEVIPLTLWSDDKTEAFMREKISMFQEALDLPDDMITPCSRQERWEDKPQYALVKTGSTRATKLFDTPDEAKAYWSEKFNDDLSYDIQERFKEPKKCAEYCSVNKYCNFYKERFNNEIVPNLKDIKHVA